MMFGVKEQPKKQSAPARKSPAAQQPFPTRQQTSSARQQSNTSAVPAADAYAYRGSVDDYFVSLLHSAFPGYQVERNAHLDSPGSQGATAASWTCSCGAANTGKFCTACGGAKPADTGWTCACGQRNTGKFCAECGNPRPAANTAVHAPKNSQPLTFLLRQNGVPKMGIILCGKNSWNTEQIRSTMSACKQAKIPCLRFMREFRNDAGYVAERIRKALR
jgi:hypothetical protein